MQQAFTVTGMGGLHGMQNQTAQAVLFEGEKLIRLLQIFCGPEGQWPQLKEFILENFKYLAQHQRLNATEVRQYRQDTLDALEAYFGRSPHWSSIRNKVLNAFGDLGLGRLL